MRPLQAGMFLDIAPTRIKVNVTSHPRKAIPFGNSAKVNTPKETNREKSLLLSHKR